MQTKQCISSVHSVCLTEHNRTWSREADADKAMHIYFSSGQRTQQASTSRKKETPTHLKKPTPTNSHTRAHSLAELPATSWCGPPRPAENTTRKHQPKKGNAHAPRKANANKLSYESLPLQLTSIIVTERFDMFLGKRDRGRPRPNAC